MTEFYKIRVAVGSLSIELESHDRQWVEGKESEYMKELFSNPELFRQLSGKGTDVAPYSSPLLDDAKITINEFYQKYIAGKNYSRVQVSLFFVYYLEKIKKQSVVVTSDIKAAFKEIQYPKYQTFNFTDLLNSLKKKGYLNKDANNWKLTITGIDNVMAGLSTD